METCHNCGKSVAGQRFCTACGTPIVGPEPSDPQGESTSTAQWGMDLAHSGEPPPRRSRAIVLAVTVVTAVVLMAAVGGYLALRPGGLLTATTAGAGSAAPTAGVSTTAQPAMVPSNGSTASRSGSVTSSEPSARSPSTAPPETSAMTPPDDLFSASDAALISLNGETVSHLLGFTPLSWTNDQKVVNDFGGPLNPPQCQSLVDMDEIAAIGYHTYGFSYRENLPQGPVGWSAEIHANVLSGASSAQQFYDRLHTLLSQCGSITTYVDANPQGPAFNTYSIQPLDVEGLAGFESFSFRQAVYFPNNGTTSRTAVTVIHDSNAIVTVYSFADGEEEPALGDIDAIAVLAADNLRATR